MRTLLVLAVLASLTALAGEKKLGDIVSGAGADTTNGTTAAPFIIPPGSKLTLNCSTAVNICTDTTTACTTSGAAQGVPILASSNFPTAVDPQPSASPTIIISGKTSSIVRIVGTAAVTCSVFLRSGNE